MAYKLLLMLKLGGTLIKGVLVIIKELWQALINPEETMGPVIPMSPTGGPGKVTLKFEDGTIIATGTSNDPPVDENAKVQEFFERLISGGPGLEFGKEEHTTMPMDPSPAFKILAVEKENRHIHYETLYPNVAEDRLSDFGDIHRTTFEGRPGVDVNGIPRDFVFYKGCLSVDAGFDFDRALERAVGLEHMDIKDAYENSVLLIEQDDVNNNRDYTNELYSKVEISGIPPGHMLVVTTGLRDFPLYIDGDVAKIVLNEAASSDGFLRRYRLQINSEVSMNFAASYCYETLKKLAKEVVVQGETWDVWKNAS